MKNSNIAGQLNRWDFQSESSQVHLKKEMDEGASPFQMFSMVWTCEICPMNL